MLIKPKLLEEAKNILGDMPDPYTHPMVSMVTTFVREFLEAAVEQNEALRALPTVSDGWEDITTAPRDGTRILGYAKSFDVSYGPEHKAGITTMSWCTKFEFWMVEPDSAYEITCDPTHWRPLPAPPSE